MVPYASLRRVKTFLEFLISRILRIYPTYIFVTFLAIFFILFLPDNIFNSPKSLNFEKLIKTLLFFPGEDETYIFVGWTIFYQWIFYILFAFFSFRFNKIIKKPIFPILNSLTLLIFYLINNTFANRFTFFFMGTGVFYLVTFREINKEFNKKYLYFLILTLFMSIFFNLTGFLIGLLVIFLIVLEKRSSTFLKPNLFLAIGDASYSIYLIQVITYPGSLKISNAFFSSQTILMPSYSLFYFFSLTIGVLSTVIAGLLIHKCIEIPSFKILMNSYNPSNK